MIRRACPLGGDGAPERWLLIRQTDHAEQSWRLARDWADLPLPSDAVREEFLAAVRHHDDGWDAWDDAPRIDPEHSRPYSFTEMPPADAQRIWTDSIAACRAIGPLAGWVVASHFSALQSKRDGDYPEWIDWLAEVDSERSVWLNEWLAASTDHTPELADRCLAWLQAFDWISLWLCCVCPDPPHAADADPLVIGGGPTAWSEVRFTPTARTSRGESDWGDRQAVEVTPWPFTRQAFGDLVSAREVSARPIERSAIVFEDASPCSLAWWLCPTG